MSQGEQQFFAVVNHEEQYSIWPEGKALPGGWSEAFGPAGKEACLDYIEKNWTDMRPLSLRQHMAATASS